MIEDNIIKNNITLPNAPNPVGSYLATKIVGKLLYISGQISMDENGNLANVIVYLKGITYKGGPPKEPAILDQKGCLYSPHVLGIMKGQELLTLPLH